MTVAERDPIKVKVAVHETRGERADPIFAGRWYANCTLPIIESAFGDTKNSALANLKEKLERAGLEVELVEF